VSGYTTGLTAIKPQEDSSSITSVVKQEQYQNKEANKAMAIRAEADELIKIKSTISTDIENLSLQRNREYKQISSELAVLTKTKAKLLEQIKAIGKMLYVLEKARSRGAFHFDSFFKDREDILVNFSAAVSSKIDKQLNSLNDRTSTLNEAESFIDELYTYSENLLEVAYKRFGEVIEANKQLQSEAKKISDTEKDLRKRSKKLISDEDLVKSKLTAAIGVEQTTRETLRNAKEEAYTLLRSANSKVKGIRIQEQTVSAKEKFLDKREKLLNNKERLLADKEQSLRRLAQELRGWHK
jgi:hypothetical protein